MRVVGVGADNIERHRRGGVVGDMVESEEDDDVVNVDDDDEVDVEDELEEEACATKDMFDSDIEDYHKTTPVSRFRPPRLPPPTHFPRKQEFREAAGRQGGRHGERGGRHGERGGRHGDKDHIRPMPSGLVATGGQQRWPHNISSLGSSGHPRKSHLGSDSAGSLVAEMKLGASGHNDPILRLKCPPFQELPIGPLLYCFEKQPSEIGCYSRTADNNVYLDDRCLRHFRSKVLVESGADLNKGFESFIEKREDSESSGFGDLLGCLRSKRIPLDNIHFVTYRNNLNKILGTAYNRVDPWEMGVHMRHGTVYLDVHKLPEGPQTVLQQRRCYWGYSFEKLATERPIGHRSSSELSRHSANGGSKNGQVANDNSVVDANVEFCAVLRTKLGPHRIVMGAEMDCYDTIRDGRKSYVELKTNRELETRTTDRFEREKLLKFWIQSFLAGVPRIVCGFRDDTGRLVRTEAMSTKDITHRVKAKHFWEGGACLAFADKVLCWLYGSVKENEDYKLRFLPTGHRLELLRADSCPDVITNHASLL